MQAHDEVAVQAHDEVEVDAHSDYATSSGSDEEIRLGDAEGQPEPRATSLPDWASESDTSPEQVAAPVAQVASDAGLSLADRIAAAEQEPSTDDSIEAVRNEAMIALEEARSIREESFAESHPAVQDDSPSTDTVDPAVPEASHEEERPVFDYSPAVAPAPTPVEELDDDDEDEAEEPTESRYSRNSARLPRIGIEPGANADTIANLRKKMRES